MDQPTLIAALERIDPDSVRRVLQALRTESDLQNKTPAKPSPAFADVVAQLNATEADSPEYPFVRELLEFLKAWEVTLQPSGQLATVTEQPVDADRLIIAFRQRFLAHTLDVERNFAQLETNFEYIYRRRNTALTFLFGVVVVLLLDMPIATIYRTAKSMTSEQAIALAEAARGAYDSLVAVQASDTGAERQEDSVRAGRYRQISDSVLASLTKAGAAGLPDSTEEKGYLAVRMGQLWNQLFVDKTGKALAYLAECLVTALLISFGAPFWNDVAGALLRVSKGPAEPAPAKPAQDS